MKKYDDLIQEVLETKHRQNQVHAQNIRFLLESPSGDSLMEIISSLISGYKDAHVFAETDEERAVHKGSILCLSALGSYLTTIAESYKEPDARGDVDVEDMFKQSSLTVGEAFEE